MLPADRPASSTTPGARAGEPQRRRGDEEAGAGERRKSGTRRRASDRLFDRATRSYPQTEALSQVRNLENLVLFIDDDLRETALGLRHIEDYLIQALCLLERPRLSRNEVQAVATDGRVLEHVDTMVETLESLRRRLARLAASLR
ncbi:MAG: hypothetical protein R3A79_01385 [Nannocystaceae bacterium]